MTDDSVSAGLVLEVLPDTFAICRLAPRARVPRWIYKSPFTSVTRSGNELSVVCQELKVPDNVRAERGWRAIRVAGILDFGLTGVLAALANPLSREKISIFAVSTFDTDYLLVREKGLAAAVAVLESEGHRFDSIPEALSKPEQPIADAPDERLEPIEAVESEPSHDAADDKRVSDEPEDRASVIGDEDLDDTEDLEDLDDAEDLEDLDDDEDLDDADDLEDLEGDQEILDTTPEDEEKSVDDTPVVADSEKVEADVVSDLGTAKKRSSDEGAVSDGMYSGAIPQHPVEITGLSFAELGLSDAILETVEEIGFEHPTPIQAAVIPEALAGRDVLGLAETGSGKTAAFALPLAEKLTHGKGTRGLILCPTREIALQTRAFLEIFGRDHELDTVVVIGGVKMGPQIDGLRRRADIIVATPGRLADHLRRGNASLHELEELVLDEADHMLDLGFLPQIREILEQIPEGRRTMMFSATMPPQISSLVTRFMNDPVRVDIRPAQQVASGIEHRLYLVDEKDKRACVEQLLREVPGSTLIFTRRKLHAEWLARQLGTSGFRVERIHSDRSQARRVRALKTFREGEIRILVATDVAARGIDVPRIEHVINYDLPGQVEDYVHRAGRTARGNAAGTVSSIGTWQDKLMVGYIQSDLGIELTRHTAEGISPYVELKKKKTVRRRRLL